MRSRASRAATGWLVALVATVVAAASHTLAGGVAPSVFGVGASLLLAGSACSLLSAPSQSLWRLSASVAVSQVLFHSLFSGMGIPTAAAHTHEAVALAPTHGHASDMWLAHMLAGVITLIVLRHAESAVIGLARCVRLAAARMLTLPHPEAPIARRPLVPPSRVIRPRPLAVSRGAQTYRGPPVGLSAA